MLHLDPYVWFDAGYCRQEVIQDLLGGHAEFPATCGHLYPATLVPVIALGKVLGTNQDKVAVIGKPHILRGTD